MAIGALFVGMALGACGLSVGIGSPGDDGGPSPDALEGADVAQYADANALLLDVSLATDAVVPGMDGCVVEPSRWIDSANHDYGTNVEPVAEVIADRATYEMVWRERYHWGCCDPAHPVPDPPAVDFVIERVIWHTFYRGDGSPLLAPEVLRCDNQIVFRPRYYGPGPEYAITLFTLATIPQGDTPVVFLEPEGIWP